MTDGRHPHALFDPDDIPDEFDWDFVNQWYHAVFAILSMGPAYLLLFIVSPIMFPLIILGLCYWTGWGTYRIVRRLGLATLHMLGAVLHALRDLMRLAQR